MNNNNKENNNDNDLLKCFNLNNTLEIKDKEQLKRIRKKMDLLIESNKLDFLFVSENKKSTSEISNIKFKNIPNSITNQIYYKEVVLKNACFAFISLGAYFYFNKYSNFLNNVNSIYYYKKLFLLTFCFVPILLNYNFSKMNYEFKMLELKLGKDNKNNSKSFSK